MHEAQVIVILVVLACVLILIGQAWHNWKHREDDEWYKGDGE